MTGGAQKTAAQTYAEHLREARCLIHKLERMITIHERRQSARPDDWGFAGDLRRIIDGLREITPAHTDRRCEWRTGTMTCGEYAWVCLPDGRLVCPEHAPESGFGPDECLNVETGMPADAD